MLHCHFKAKMMTIEPLEKVTDVVHEVIDKTVQFQSHSLGVLLS
jgi:hypothetical protein